MSSLHKYSGKKIQIVRMSTPSYQDLKNNDKLNNLLFNKCKSISKNYDSKKLLNQFSYIKDPNDKSELIHKYSNNFRETNSQGQLLHTTNSNNQFIQTEKKVNHVSHSNISKKELKTLQLKLTHLGLIYNEPSIKPNFPKQSHNTSGLGFPSNFCLIGDPLCSYEKKSTGTKTFIAISPTFNLRKILRQECKSSPYIEILGRKRLIIKNNNEIIKKAKGVHKNYDRTTSSDSVFNKKNSNHLNPMKIEDNKLIKLIDKTKELIMKYQKSEEELIKENKRLRQEVNILQKNIDDIKV